MTANKWTLMKGLGREAGAGESGFAAALAQAYHLLAGGWKTNSLADAGEQLQQRLALSNDEKEDFVWLARHMGETLRERRLDRLRVSTLKRQMADARWPDLLLLHRTATAFNAEYSPVLEDTLLARMNAEGVAPEPFVTGDTLIRLGAAPGPQFKKWLEELYDRQLEGEFSTAQQAHEVARRLIDAGGAR